MSITDTTLYEEQKDLLRRAAELLREVGNDETNMFNWEDKRDEWLKDVKGK